MSGTRLNDRGAALRGDGNNWTVAMVLAVLALVLVPVNAWLATQAQVQAQLLGQRRTYLAQTPQLARLVEVAATELARASLQTNDAAIKALLTRNGITVTPNPAPAGAPGVAPTPAPADPATPTPAPPAANTPAPTPGTASPTTPSTVRPR